MVEHADKHKKGTNFVKKKIDILDTLDMIRQLDCHRLLHYYLVLLPIHQSLQLMARTKKLVKREFVLKVNSTVK